jgi:hypothetical protein
MYSTLSVYCVYIQENLLVKGENVGHYSINELISNEIIISIKDPHSPHRGNFCRPEGEGR